MKRKLVDKKEETVPVEEKPKEEKPDIYGRAAFASTLAGYFVMLANLGMPNYAMRTCAKQRDDAKMLRHVFSELWSIGAITAVASTVFYIAVIFLAPTLRENSSLFLIYGCSVLLQAFNCEWLFKGLEEFRLIAIVSLICRVVSFLFL